MIKSFATFVNEHANYTFHDLNYPFSLYTQINKLKKLGLIDDYWMDFERDLDGNSLKRPVVKIGLPDDNHVYIFDQQDSKDLSRLLTTLETTSIHIPREEIESIKIFRTLVKEGWDPYHINENRSSFILGYQKKLNTQNGYLYILGLSFRKNGDQVTVKLQSNMKMTLTERFSIEKTVAEIDCIQTATQMYKEFYQLWTDTML